MWNLLWRIVAGVGNFTREEAAELYGFLLQLMFSTVLLILVMWGVNAFWMKEVNFAFFILGGMYIVAKALQPRMLGIAAVAGAAVQGLRDEDISQGAVKGLQALYKVALGLLLGFWLLSGILSTWSFQQAPLAFFPIAAMVLTLAVMSAFFGLKGKAAVTVITTYAVVVIAIATWQTIPADVKPFQGSATTTPQQPVVQAPPAPNTDPFKGPVYVKVTGLKPVIIQPPLGMCVWWSDARGPDFNADYDVEVWLTNGTNWVPWTDFLKLRAEASRKKEREPHFTHVKFISMVKEVIIEYRYGVQSQCT